MFRKTIIATLTVALVAGSALVSSRPAAAKDGKNTAIAAAAVVGAVAGAIIASSASKSNDHRDFRGHRHGRRFETADNHRHGFASSRNCIAKPIIKYDRFTGRDVVVGQKLFCR